MIIRDLLAEATLTLASANVPDAKRDAQILLADCLAISAGEIILRQQETVSAEVAERFRAHVLRRAKREPVSQIIGYREFWGRRFSVTSDVLDPRPETETLIEAALKLHPQRILDLGTGSGILAITLELEIPGAEVVAVDISPDALRVADINARALGSEVEFLRSDWFAAVEGQFDLIVSNPPYISASERPSLSPELLDHEPAIALFADEDGLLAYKTIAQSADNYLTPDGRILVEIGHSQTKQVTEIFAQNQYRLDNLHQDMSGHDRILEFSRNFAK